MSAVLSILSFNVPATSVIYTLSLHDALPISFRVHGRLLMRSRGVARNRILRCGCVYPERRHHAPHRRDRKSTRLNSSHVAISYAVFCLKKKRQTGGENRHTRG